MVNGGCEVDQASDSPTFILRPKLSDKEEMPWQM